MATHSGLSKTEKIAIIELSQAIGRALQITFVSGFNTREGMVEQAWGNVGNKLITLIEATE